MTAYILTLPSVQVTDLAGTPLCQSAPGHHAPAPAVGNGRWPGRPSLAEAFYQLGPVVYAGFIVDA